MFFNVADRDRLLLTVTCGTASIDLHIALCPPVEIYQEICWEPEIHIVALEQACNFTRVVNTPDGFPKEHYFINDILISQNPQDKDITNVMELKFKGDAAELPDAIYELEGETVDEGCLVFVTLKVLKLDRVESTSIDHPIEEFNDNLYIFLDPERDTPFVIPLEAYNTVDEKEFPSDSNGEHP